MDYAKDMPGESSCTTCQMSEDFSNYWTAILYFKARNGTYKRVHQLANAGFEGSAGGVEIQPEQKDPLQVAQFVQAARAALALRGSEPS